MCWRNRDYNYVQLSDLINPRRFDPAGGGVGAIMSPVNAPRISVKSFLLSNASLYLMRNYLPRRVAAAEPRATAAELVAVVITNGRNYSSIDRN